MNKIYSLALSAAVVCLAGCSPKPEAFDPDIKNNSLAVSPDESMAAVCASNIPKVNIYDLNAGTLSATIEDVVTPRNIAFSKDGSTFYISDSSCGNIREYDADTYRLKRTFPLEKGVFGFAIDYGNNRIYANNHAENSVSVINLETGKTEKVIKGFNGPRQGIALADDGRSLYVTNFGSDDVKVVDVATEKIVKTLSGIPAVRQISVDASRNALYGASSSENAIFVIDISTGAQIAKIGVGKEPYGAKLSPDLNTLLSGEKGSNAVSVINAADYSVLGTVTGLDAPRQAIVFSKANPGQAYVLNADLSVSVINYKDFSVARTIRP